MKKVSRELRPKHRKAPQSNFRQQQLVNKASQSITPPNELREWFVGYVDNHKGRISEDIAIMEDLGIQKQDDVLDIGSVPLLLLAAQKTNGHKMTGIDIDPTRFEPAIQELKLQVKRCNIESEILPFEDASFDFIVMNEVFEHLRIDLIHTISELHRVLRPGGRCMISTPNQRSAAAIRNLIQRDKSAGVCPDLYREWSKIGKLGHMGHVREYTVTDLSNFLSKIGFNVEEVLFRGDPSGRLNRLLCATNYRFLPFFTIVVKKDLC